MEPILRDGALALTRRITRRRAIRRGDIVVAWSAEAGGEVVKRVVGLPGETVSLDAGRVSIDGIPLDEPYASESVFTATYHVPPEHYFVLGDNREQSIDSRSWTVPYLPRRAIIGRVTPAARHRA